MDLPTCPHCGQSVLDDDAAECPFCGGAMDGSGKAAPPSPAPETKPAVTSSSSGGDDDDPFALTGAPQPRKVIQCARKPIKGRTRKVVCPMCDRAGYIPRSAFGKQVRCANKECMVPVFTAESPDKAEEKVPMRISDEEAPVPTATDAAGSSKGSIAVKIGGGVVLIALGLGIAFYFQNQTGETQLPPPDIPIGSGGSDEDEPEVQGGDQNPVVEKTDHDALARQVIAGMIEAARANDNQQRGHSRRLTGDAFLQLGDHENAEKEFKQMRVVSVRHREKSDHYIVGPYTTRYWQLKAAGDAASAKAALDKAQPLADKIPLTGGLSTNFAVSLAAVMADAGQLDAAIQLVVNHQRDQTTGTYYDGVRGTAWHITAEKLWQHSQPSLSVLRVYTWNDPLVTATVVGLALNGSWQSAINLSKKSEQEQTVCDSLSVVASLSIQLNAGGDVQTAILDAAREQGGVTEIAVTSIIARDQAQAPAWQRAGELVDALAETDVAVPGSIPEIIDAERPDMPELLPMAGALTEFAITAQERGESDRAVAAVAKLTTMLMAEVPPTPVVRGLATEIDANAKGVQAEVAKSLGIRKFDDARNKFLAYRKSVDRMVRASEQRRVHLLQQLGHMVQAGAGALVNSILGDSENMTTQEVAVDDLIAVLKLCALESKEQVQLTVPDSSLKVPPAREARTSPSAFYKIAPVCVMVAEKIRTDGDLTAFAQLSRIPELPGFRAAICTRLTELRISSEQPTRERLEEILKIPVETWRRNCLEMATLQFAARSDPRKFGTLLTGISMMTSAERVVAWYPVALRHMQLSAEVPEEDDEKE